MSYEQIWHIFVVGFAILFGAIIINFIASLLGLSTWYVFINNIQKMGFIEALSAEKFISLLFMFVVYPFLLGSIGYYLTRFLL